VQKAENIHLRIWAKGMQMGVVGTVVGLTAGGKMYSGEESTDV